MQSDLKLLFNIINIIVFSGWNKRYMNKWIITLKHGIINGGIGSIIRIK